MFAVFKQIFNPRNKQMRKRILFTFAALFIFKLGTAIIVPGIDKELLTGNLGFLELMNTMGGGAMERFSIFSLGVMPYISASIIIQLLTMDFVPYFSELKKQGQVGRTKLNIMSRYLGIMLAFIQGYMFSFTYLNDVSPLQHLEVAVILTAGTAFLLWLGDQITLKGVGNGISMIIMAGIIASLPTMFTTAWESMANFSTAQTTALGITKFVIFVLLYIALIIGIIFEENAERRVPIQYANKSVEGGVKQSYIPLKLNPSGVMPVIFASAIISIPSIIADFIKNDSFKLFVNKWLVMNSVSGFIIYVLLILGITYLYTLNIQMKPKEVEENIKNSGGFIPGIRLGDETIKYISKTLTRITFVGAVALAFIAGLPTVFSAVSNLPTSVSIGGTGIIIVVGVILETYRQLESELLSTNNSVKRIKKRGRR